MCQSGLCQCTGCSDDLPVCQSELCQCTGCSNDLPLCQSGLCQCIWCSDDLPVCVKVGCVNVQGVLMTYLMSKWAVSVYRVF